MALDLDICFMLKAVKNIRTQHNYIEPNIVQYHSKRCVIVLVVLQSTVARFLHIRSRVVIEEEKHVSRLPELTCSCRITMVTHVSVEQLLTSACFTCHKLTGHL